MQDYIRRHAHRRAMAMPEAYRLLLAFEHDRLIACGAHHREPLVGTDAKLLDATRLHLLAIAVAEQGARLDDDARLSDVLLTTLIRDAISHSGINVVTAVVARDNLRSIALCERNGLRSQVRYDHRHVRLTGHFAVT